MIVIKRGEHIFAGFLAVFILLVLAVGNISIIKGREYSSSAAQQRISDDTAHERGNISDRNLIPLTDGTFAGASAANHVVGYTFSDGSGASGIEKTMNDELSSGGASALLDAKGEEIPNFKPEGAKGRKTVKLTLDYHIQKVCENVLNEYGIQGGAVIVDIESFDVLAMASRPDFSRKDISRYITGGGTELMNRCVTSYKADGVLDIITGAVGENDIDRKREFAEKLGIGKTVLGGQLPESEGGFLADSLFNQVDATPLQMAKAAAIVASGGVSKDVNIVDSLVDAKGDIIKDLRRHGRERALAQNDAEKVRDAFDSIESQGWAIGVFPCENPTFALAVMSENGYSRKAFDKICHMVSEIR